MPISLLHTFEHFYRLPDLQCVVLIAKESQPGTIKSDDVFSMGTNEHQQAVNNFKASLQCDEPINIQFTSVSYLHIMSECF